jgi:hypothetical protein
MLRGLVYGTIGRGLRSGNSDHRRSARTEQAGTVMVDRAARRLSVLLVVAVTLVTVSSVAVAQAEPMPNGIPGTWALKLNEEFSGSSLNTALWTSGWQSDASISGPMSNECVASKNVSQNGNGYLYLQVRKEKATCGTTNVEDTGGLIESNPADGQPGHSGYAYTYGIVEWEAYVPGVAPTGRGCPKGGCLPDWPALWSLSSTNTDEIDTMEGLETLGQACFHIHPPPGSEGPGGCLSGSYAGAWHTYAAWWEPGVVKYFYDGAQVGELSSGVLNGTPQYLIANMVPPGCCNQPLQVPDEMTVNYVRVWRHPVPPEASTSPASGLRPLQATLNGNVNPKGESTEFYFRYGKTTVYGATTPETSAGSGSGSVGVSTNVTLEPGTTYHYRIVARNAGGTVEGSDQELKTPGPVEAATTAVSGLTEAQATLNGTINPRGYGAKYYFQYGKTTSYGSVTNEGDAGAGSSPVPESATLTHLEAGKAYHYRLVGTSGGVTSYGADQKFTTQDESSSSRWLDANLDSGETSLYYRNSSGAVAYWQWHPVVGWEKGVLGGSIATGTTPAVLYAPSTGETSVYYQTSSHEVAFWQWLPVRGWGSGVIGGHMAPGTNPAVMYSVVSAETTIYYQNSSGEIAFWQWVPVKGWSSGVLGGHAAAGTTPAVVYNPATGEPTIYYQNSSGEIAYWQWAPVKGWSSGVLGGHAAAGTTPAVVVDWATPETTIYYQNSSGEMAYWQWQLGKGWGSGTLGGHVAAGTTPAVVVEWATPETTIYYQNSSGEMAYWQWQLGKGWGSGTLGGHAAAGSTPAVVANLSTPETTIYDENSGGEMAFWQWELGRGWAYGVV